MSSGSVWTMTSKPAVSTLATRPISRIIDGRGSQSPIFALAVRPAMARMMIAAKRSKTAGSSTVWIVGASAATATAPAITTAPTARIGVATSLGVPSISARITASVAEPPKTSRPTSTIPVTDASPPARTTAAKTPSSRGSSITVASSRVAPPTRRSSASATGCWELLISRYSLPSPVGVGYSRRWDDAAGEQVGASHAFENPSNAVSPANQFVTTTASVVCRRASALVDTARVMFVIIFCQRINVV